MSLTATPQTSPSPTPSTTRSLLSRLTSPLRSRTRNLTDFEIRPSEPHRKYSPGDVVKGLVVLTVVKPIRITHLTVALHGFVRVFKSPNGVADGPGPDPAPGSSSAQSQYFGNGQASLFQDEVTLCGEGRLEIGVWEFEFELEFPKKGLPTSIDFERGSISYLIRATVTRPTSIAPTSNCDRKISFVETVDIGPMVPPNPRTISLEPISKRSKKSPKSSSSKGKSKSVKEPPDLGSVAEGAQHETSPKPEESASQRPSSDHTREPRSPSDLHSETSGESVVSSSSTGLSFRLGAVPHSAKSSRDSQGGSNASVASKTITVTIELLKAGCLPGDIIPLKVSIQHIKFIKSLHGIIITLYRQGRIDSAPPLSLFTDVKGKAAEKLKHEDYYPKSKTGLGGLSLKSAGSSSVFRKDLSQTFAPIIIDPSKLSTVVSASIRVPEDAFPTITNVPGQMISFRYHIEVVVDLGGKLASYDKQGPRLGMVNVQSNFINIGNMGNNMEGVPNPGMLTSWGSNIIDTDNIRREEGVIACLFELIVGTTDSARLRGRGNIVPGTQTKVQTPQSPTFPSDPVQQNEGQRENANEETPEDQNYYSGECDQQESYYADDGDYSHRGYDPTSPHDHYILPFVPVPEVPAEDELSEKGQIRRAEERLLPSQPFHDDDPSSSRTIVPSAPEDPEDSMYFPENARDGLGTMSPGEETLSRTMMTSAPDLSDLAPQAMSRPRDDKHELERQRLMAEASSPPDFPEDHENASEGGSGMRPEPSAPALNEEDVYGGHFGGATGHQEGLPRYER